VGLVDIGNSLSEIERSILAVVNALDLQQSLIFILLDLASSETEEYSLDPQSDGSASLSWGLSDLLRSLSDLGGLLGGFGHLFFSLN